MRALVIEDEKRLAQNVARALKENASRSVDIALDGENGLHTAESLPYDLIVLDLMLPKLDGLELLRRYRKQGNKTPVLVLTAREEKQSVVTLLNSGADDYLSKPFDLGEFLARAKALVRRARGHDPPLLTVDDLELNTVERTIRRGEHNIIVTPMEYRVLEYLARRPRVVIPKTELLEYLYDYNWEKFSNVIEVYISGLRRKIDDGAQIKLIHTVRGHGYVLGAQQKRW